MLLRQAGLRRRLGHSLQLTVHIAAVAIPPQQRLNQRDQLHKVGVEHSRRDAQVLGGGVAIAIAASIIILITATGIHAFEVRVGNNNALEATSSSSGQWTKICYYRTSSSSSSIVDSGTATVLAKLMGFSSGTRTTATSSSSGGYSDISCPSYATRFSHCTLGRKLSVCPRYRYASSAYKWVGLKVSIPRPSSTAGGGVYISSPSAMFIRQNSVGAFQRRSMFSSTWSNIVGNTANVLSSITSSSSSCGGKSGSMFDTKAGVALCVAIGYSVSWVKLKSASSTSGSPGYFIGGCNRTAVYSSSSNMRSDTLFTAGCVGSTSSSMLRSCTSSSNVIAVDCSQTSKNAVPLGNGYEGYIDIGNKLWIRPSSRVSWGTMCTSSSIASQNNADAICGALGYRRSTGTYSRLSTTYYSSGRSLGRYFTNLVCPSSSESSTVTSLDRCTLKNRSISSSSNCGSGYTSSRYWPVVSCGAYSSSAGGSGSGSSSGNPLDGVNLGAIIGPVVGVVVLIIVLAVLFSVIRSAQAKRAATKSMSQDDGSSSGDVEFSSFGISSSPSSSQPASSYQPFMSPTASSYQPNPVAAQSTPAAAATNMGYPPPPPPPPPGGFGWGLPGFGYDPHQHGGGAYGHY